MYKVFFKDKLFRIISSEIPDYQGITDSINDFIRTCDKDYDYRSINPEKDFLLLKSHFKYIEAAGGIVFDNRNRFLCMERLGYSDFPKGKIEKNELPKAAALREILEECGINELEIVQELEPSFHIYFEKTMILKKTFWYEVRYSGNTLPQPQTEENIVSVKFFETSFASELKQRSYRNLHHLFDFIQEKIHMQ